MLMSMKTKINKEKPQIVLIFIVLVFSLIYTHNLEGWLINDDEGSFLYQVWRMVEGEQPYRDFLSSRDPLFLYFGSMWMKLFGVSVITMRMSAVIATLLSSLVVYSISTHILSPDSALISILVFLINPDIFNYGRLFQPEPFYLLFICLGIYFSIHAMSKKREKLLAVSGISFAIAALFKLLGILSLLGIIAYQLITGISRKQPFIPLLKQISLIVIPFILIFGLCNAYFYFNIPGYSEGVIDVNFAQGSDLTFSQIILKGIIFLIIYAFSNSPLVLIVLSSVFAKKQNAMQRILVWQLPSVFAFTLLSRQLFPRLLYYLIPTMIILLIIVIEPLRFFANRKYYSLLLGVIVIPWLWVNGLSISRTETATMFVADHIANLVDANTLVLSDYQELNFYARRASTYHGAELSQVIIEGGSITGKMLITEMMNLEVDFVVLDVSPKTGVHLLKLHDYEIFRDFLSEYYELVDTIPRREQRLEIHKIISTE